MVDATLVTIHGFWSSPGTWDRLDAIWNADEQLHGLRIHPFRYPSPKKPLLLLSTKRVPDYDDLAQTLATEYRVGLAEASNVAIVTHSQGGLILQRFLAWMLDQGRGRELARIRSIVILACPNGGSEYLRSIRRVLWFGHHPQAGSLKVLDRRVTDTQRTVLERIVNATGVDDRQCRIPFHVYAGDSDKIVTAASAQGAFPQVGTLPGDHSSILDPDAPGNRTAETVKQHLLDDLAANSATAIGRGRSVQRGHGSAAEAAAPGMSRPVTTWDAHRLGVHHAITADSVPGQALPDLTAYVPRAHDARLRELLAAPVRPVMVVLVGGSSTGKTRAAVEAVRECLPDWSLLRPADAAGLMSQLHSGAVSPRTVLWLNETQIFLRDWPDVASALRDLLAGDDPVAVIGTMWPEFWKELTSRPEAREQDVNHQDRELLLQDAERVDVPETFTGTDLAELRRQLAADPRLAAAAEAARRDGKVIQVLAGGPELVQRHEHPADVGDRFGNAVLTAAMDARRVGYETPISTPFLEQAAPAYISSSDRAGTPGTWFATGLGHAAREIRGIAALTAQRDQPGFGPKDEYVLHDYLDQYARAARRGVLVPGAVWDALTVHALNPGDQAGAAQQAQWLGLYRYAVALARPAAEAGDSAAMQLLAFRLDEAGHADEAEQWRRRAAEAGEPVAVQLMAQRLDERGDHEGAEAILRNSAARGDASAILSLAGRLDAAGQRLEAEHLLAQGADSGGTGVMENLESRLREEGRREEAEVWLRRAAEAGDIFAMQRLAGRLDEVGQAEEAETWLVRAAELDDHFAHFVRLRLYQRLDEAGRPDEADRWLRRDIEAGDTSFLWILAGRLEQSGRAEEAEVLRQRARDAGEYMALYPAIAELEQAGGGLDDFEQLLRRPAEAGELFAMQTLARKFDEAGRETEANQWLGDLARVGNLGALHVLAGRLELANRNEEAERVWRRIIELGNSAGVHNLAQRLERNDPDRADNLRRYGIEPGGSTAAPW